MHSRPPSNQLLKVLKNPQFLIFSLSVVFTQMAVNMLNIVLIFRVYQLTSSSFAVSLLVLTFLVPQILFSFLGGIIADAKNKRKILIVGNVLRALTVSGLFIFSDQLIVLYILALLFAIVTQFYVPAETPMIPHLVKKNELFPANAIFGVSLFGSILVGYVLAGPAIRIFTREGIFLFIAFLFVISGVCVYLMPNVAPSVIKLRTERTLIKNIVRLYKLVFTEFWQTLQIIRKQPPVASSLLFLALSQVIILVLATIIPGYAQKTLLIPAEDISLFVFAPAALGTVVSALSIGSVFTNLNKQNLMNVGLIVSSIVLFLFGLINYQDKLNLLYATMGITFIAGLANSFVFIPSQTLIQSQVKDEFRSKIYGLLFAGVGILALIPILVAGIFADVLGVRAVLLGIAALLLGLAIGKIIFYKDR